MLFPNIHAVDHIATSSGRLHFDNREQTANWMHYDEVQLIMTDTHISPEQSPSSQPKPPPHCTFAPATDAGTLQASDHFGGNLDDAIATARSPMSVMSSKMPRWSTSPMNLLWAS